MSEDIAYDQAREIGRLRAENERLKGLLVDQFDGVAKRAKLQAENERLNERMQGTHTQLVEIQREHQFVLSENERLRALLQEALNSGGLVLKGTWMVNVRAALDGEKR